MRVGYKRDKQAEGRIYQGCIADLYADGLGRVIRLIRVIRGV
jgi:hypothetical protein